MDLKHVLEEIPGCDRRFLYYLEAQGYISPAKVWKRRIARRNYSPEDARISREVWRHYQRGYSVQSAHELATRPQRVYTYVSAQVPGKETATVMERLKAHPQVLEASAVYGTDQDILLQTESADVNDFYHTLVPILAGTGISNFPQLFTVKEHYRRSANTRSTEGMGMLAYILMKVPGKHVEGVMERLKALPTIQEASTLYGESDILVKAQVDTQQELDALVMEQLHGIAEVESTRTFIVIGSLHWSR